MVSEIIIQNQSTKEQITISQDQGNFILDNVDWDAPAVNFSTYRIPYQVGQTMAGVEIGTRKPQITGYVIASYGEKETMLGREWEEYYAEQKEKIDDKKMELDDLINVNQDVMLRVGDYMLDARPASPPVYSSAEEGNNEVLCMFQLTFECFSPLFYKSEKTYTLSQAVAAFHFPLIIPSEKVIFGKLLRKRQLSIVNSGGSEIGMTIIIAATGSVTDPVVYNVTTGEYIGFQGLELSSGDTLTITTDKGHENVVHHKTGQAADVNVVGKVTSGSTFIRLKQGTSVIDYDVDEEQVNNISVVIKYTERFYNIRGM